MEMNEIGDVFKERLKSSMYGSFFIAWCIINWQLIYLTFFVDQDLIYKQTGLFKLDYIPLLYSNFFNIYFIQNDLLVFGYFLFKIIVLPSIAAYLIVWHLSKIEHKFFKKNTANRMKNFQEELRQKEILSNETTKVLKAEKDMVIAQKNIEKELSTEEKWDMNYEKAKETEDFDRKMIKLRNCIYENNGQINIIIFPEDLAFYDVNDLAQKNIMPSGTTLVLTSKGKHFIKRFMEGDNNKAKYS